VVVALLTEVKRLLEIRAYPSVRERIRAVAGSRYLE
jgi:hypothetical protein